MARAIFISYRRDDSEGEAGRLFDDLVRSFGDDSVFMDVSGINPGTDFRAAIDDNVASCGVLLAIIGPGWATITNGSGQRRLDDPNDFVRLEVASALARKIPVIPVLVHDAKMPKPELLPDNLKDLAYRNSVELSHTRWNSDVQLLTAALRPYVSNESGSTAPVHATIPVQLPPANPTGVAAAPERKAKTPLIAGLSAAGAIAVAAAVFAAVHSGGHRGPVPPVPQPTPVVNPVPHSAPASATAGLEGTWVNPAPEQKNGLKRLAISANGDQFILHAWGQCQPTDCDWGQQMATVNGQKATASWSFIAEKKDGGEKGRVATVTVLPGDGALQVTVVSTYPKRPETQRQFSFTRAQ